MKRLLIDLPYFIEVARQKNFTRAANILKVPVSTLSRRITLLEQEIGMKLFYRNTRSMELTNGGQQLYERGYALIKNLEELQESIHTEQCTINGKIRVSMPADAYYIFLQGAFCSFTQKYPGIQMQVTFTERWKDPVSEPVDLNIRGGDLPDSDLIQRKLVTVFPVVYASPKLLKTYSVPKTPADLTQLPFILHATEAKYSLELQKGNVKEKLSLTPVHLANSIGLVMEFLLAGQVAALSIPTQAQKYVEQGLLVQLLPEWTASKVDLSIVMAPGRVPNRIRLFVDHLVAHLNG